MLICFIPASMIVNIYIFFHFSSFGTEIRNENLVPIGNSDFHHKIVFINSLQKHNDL